ncbi:MBL fold metallo-hydrolase [Desulfosporosinus sp. FKA]|uniref:MBL fold metallo-hydrolase n=1 Tax=Desulfosporosinus sp. FKA TaxID=1969834 RepID=UPI000B4A00DC|nr:MBL fold metallo-hydrolase [Desulfosporosinus sp. FKA]
MENAHLKIKYLYHSGFVVETRNNLLVFDYYQGSIGDLIKKSPKNIFVFSSHSHPDHFNPLILEWQKERSDIHYIFSNDILVSPKLNNLNVLAPYEKVELGSLKIKAYNSTDIGVSFLVQDEETRLFHAGDLNWWYWIDTQEEMAKAEKEFKDEIQRIKGEVIDFAFFPVDPRLEKNYLAGAEYFIRELNPKYLIPMHFADSPETLEDFVDKMKDSSCKILKFSQKGQELSL